MTEELRDSLTGLFKWSYGRAFLQEAVTAAQSNDTTLCLIYADIDCMKACNDMNGLSASDEVIKNLSNIIQSLAGENNIASRIGGDEFIVILPSVTLDDARSIAETMRKQVGQTVTEVQGRTIGSLTMTFGVAEFPKHASDAEALLQAVDLALFKGKKAGRNIVLVAQ